MKLITIFCMGVYLSGCMQVLGAKELDAWGLKVKANSGVEVSGGVMQYDSANNTKVMR
jgi:hypothetical protein